MERKYYLLEILFAPLVIALVGILGTFFINSKLDDSAAKRAENDQKIAADRAISDRQIKMLEIFGEKISGKDDRQRMLALNLLKTVDLELAANVASAVRDSEQEPSAVKKLASQVAQDSNARARDLPRIYMHIRKEENQSAAKSIGDDLRTSGFAVPGIELVGIGPPSSELRYFRKEDKPGAERIVTELGKKGVVVDLKDFSGSENSTAIRPGLYELWFAPGEPKG